MHGQSRHRRDTTSWKPDEILELYVVILLWLRFVQFQRSLELLAVDPYSILGE